MLIEKAIEAAVMSALSKLPALAGAELVSSRSAAAAGFVKEEADTTAKQMVALALGARQYDEFSLRTLNFTCALVLTTRAELCPTGAEHEEALEEILGLLDTWHNDPAAMTAALSVNNAFFAAAFRSDGGTGKSYLAERAIWSETISFTIRGKVLAN